MKTFDYSQKEIDSANTHIYIKEHSLDFLEFLRMDDYEKATKALIDGADPNFMQWNYDTDSIDNVFSLILNKFCSGNEILTTYNYSDHLSFLYNNDLNEDDQNKKKVYLFLKDFFSTWKEKGGDFNKKYLVTRDPKYYTDESIHSFLHSHADTIYDNLLVSTKCYQDEFIPFSNDFSYVHSECLDLLIKLSNDFLSIRLNPFYKNQSASGIIIREAWPNGNTQFFNIMDQESVYFSVDEKGNTPLHYPLNHLKNYNYYLKDTNSGVNINASSYLLSYSTIVEDLFSPKTFLIKNKEGLTPVEKMLQEKAYLQALALAHLIHKSNPDLLETMNIRELSLSNIKSFYGDLLSKKDEEYLLKKLETLQPYIEKSIINQALQKESIIYQPVITKKRI